MKKDNKKALYESIMVSVAKEVKKVLNENQENILNYKISTQENSLLSDVFWKLVEICQVLEIHENDDAKIQYIADHILDNLWDEEKCSQLYGGRRNYIPTHNVLIAYLIDRGHEVYIDDIEEGIDINAPFEFVFRAAEKAENN